MSLKDTGKIIPVRIPFYNEFIYNEFKGYGKDSPRTPKSPLFFLVLPRIFYRKGTSPYLSRVSTVKKKDFKPFRDTVSFPGFYCKKKGFQVF